MAYRITTRPQCCVCGLDTLRHAGWFLAVENRWLDHLKILAWHSSLASQKDMQSVCGREHLRTLIGHWLTEANLSLPPAYNDPMPIGSDANLPDFDLDGHSAGHLIGELAVHRESFSRAWSGSPETLDCILDALVSSGAEDRTQTMNYPIFDPPKSSHELSLQPSAGRV